MLPRGQQCYVSVSIWPVGHFHHCPSRRAFMPWARVFRDYILIFFFFQVELTPFVASHLFVLMLIIRAARGWGSMPGRPAAWERKLSCLREGFISQRRNCQKKKRRKKRPAAFRQAVPVTRTKCLSTQFLMQRGNITSPLGTNHRKGVQGRNYSI